MPWASSGVINCAILPCFGKISCGAISNSGNKTNPRLCIRGCGNVSFWLLRSSSPYSNKSQSSIRGAFWYGRTRPARSSIWWSACNSASAESAVSTSATALIKSGTAASEVCGQSIGAVLYNDERLMTRVSGMWLSATNADFTCKMGSAKLLPSAIKACFMRF